MDREVLKGYKWNSRWWEKERLIILQSYSPQNDRSVS